MNWQSVLLISLGTYTVLVYSARSCRSSAKRRRLHFEKIEDAFPSPAAFLSFSFHSTIARSLSLYTPRQNRQKARAVFFS